MVAEHVGTSHFGLNPEKNPDVSHVRTSCPKISDSRSLETKTQVKHTVNASTGIMLTDLLTLAHNTSSAICAQFAKRMYFYRRVEVLFVPRDQGTT